jgi:hypothetical protein
VFAHVGEGFRLVAADLCEADAALIVALRNAYPALAAELRRARKIEAAARAYVSEATNPAPDYPLRRATRERLIAALDAPDESGGR